MATFSGKMNPSPFIRSHIGEPPSGDKFVMVTEAGLDADTEALWYVQNYLQFLKDNRIDLEVLPGQNVTIHEPLTPIMVQLAVQECFGHGVQPAGEDFRVAVELPEGTIG